MNAIKKSIKKDLDTARHLAENGVPIFLARRSENFPRGGTDGRGYILPKRWQDTVADPAVLDDYQEGMAVCAVMGHAVDAIDKDPRSGGDLAYELQPEIYGASATPSGGSHELVAPLNVRSRDGILPGVDVKAGDNGDGHGFIFIAPTQRLSHDGSKLVRYTWSQRPDLEALADMDLIGETDDTGKPLAQLIDDARTETGEAPYRGDPYDVLDTEKQAMADQAQRERIDHWRELLNHAATWPEGRRDPKGRGWEALARDLAWSVASMAANPWMPLTDAQAESLYHELLPVEFAADKNCAGKWYPGLISKAANKPAEQPPWAEFDVVSLESVREHKLPDLFDDANLSAWMMDSGLDNRFCWAPGLGWMEWTGRRWKESSNEAVKEEVRQAVIALNLRAREAGMDADYMKATRSLLGLNRINAMSVLLRGIAIRDDQDFDAHPDLLNVGNGVVDLRDGRLYKHDPKYLLTKISEAAYVPDAEHDDLDQIQKALEPEVMEWMQVRFGQAATGYPTSDDIMPIGQGLGSNGKSTLFSAVRAAMGDHALTVPDRLLQARPSDHPTELMMLKGARLALIDETPEAAHLNVQRLKTVIGTDTITARKISKDPVTWEATHSMFLMTNYEPMIREVDDGTWRRLALVKFDKKFPTNDQFRARVAEGSPEFRSAMLAWIVRGAMRWYANDKAIPEVPKKVREDTDQWRYKSDAVSEFASERLVFEPGSMVLSSELYQEMMNWLESKNRSTWSDHLFTSRFTTSRIMRDHGVTRRRVYRDTAKGEFSTVFAGAPIPTRPTVWEGLRWQREDDEPQPEEIRAGQEFEEELI